MKWYMATALSICFYVNGFSQEHLASILAGTNHSATVKHFYQLADYHYAWMKKEDVRNDLFHLLENAGDYGFDNLKYPPAALKRKLNNTMSSKDSAEADIIFTEAAIDFFIKVKTGFVTPVIAYGGLKYKPDVSGLPGLLLEYTSGNKLMKLATVLEPQSKAFHVFKSTLLLWNKRKREKDFNEIMITSDKVSVDNTPLKIKLYQLGFLDSISHAMTNKMIIEKLRSAQQLFDVLADGKLRSTTLAALNVPLSQRIAEIKIAMNWMQWAQGLTQNTVLLLNIPAAQFYIYNSDTIILESRVVVGKSSTPTPTLTSTITEVILYPYWHVPNKIAVKELLPHIKRNINYLEENNFQVLNRQGKVLNPNKIDWKALNAVNFPYTIWQSTGCDNSLGIVKFNFYNPYSVYLHDTPNKLLFSYNKRYYSHGCMRVEQFEKMAHMLLGQNRIAIDTLIEKGCINQQAPITIEAEQHLPIVIMYSTAWYSPEGKIKFYDDIYQKIPSLIQQDKQ